MKIEEGKFYKTRDGRKVGPIQKITEDDGFHPDWKWRAPYPWGSDYWTEDGLIGKGPGGKNDIVSECTEEGPVRTVTRREIVPGTYGRVKVWADMPSSCVRLGLGEPSGVNCYDFTADELRSAATIFSQLAEALDENADNA